MQTLQFDCLQWVVRALCQPAEVQRSLFPSYAVTPDELALQLEEAVLAARANRRPLNKTIEVLDEELTRMSGPEKPHWLDEALESEAWNHVRSLAYAAAKQAGWSTTNPGPRPDVVYVGPAA